MNTMKLWKGTNNIAWLIEALLSSFFFLLFCCSPPFSLTHFSLPITLTFLSPFLPFLVGPVSFRCPSLLALPLYYLMPSPSSTLTFLSPFLPFLVGPVSSPFSFPLSLLPKTTLRPLHLFPSPHLLLVLLLIQTLLLPPYFRSPLIPLFSLFNLSFSSTFSFCSSRSSCSLYRSKLLPSSRTSHPLLD